MGPHAPQGSRSFQLKRLPGGGLCLLVEPPPQPLPYTIFLCRTPAPLRLCAGTARLPPGVCQGGPQSVLPTHRACTQGPGGSFYSDCKASLSMRLLKTNLIYLRPCWLFVAAGSSLIAVSRTWALQLRLPALNLRLCSCSEACGSSRIWDGASARAALLTSGFFTTGHQGSPR